LRGVDMPLTYAFRLAPGPQALDQAMLAEKLGYERVWSPEVPAFGHDIWVHLARIAERTQRIGIGPAVLIPSYRHPVAQASAIATLEHIAPGRLMVAFGTGFTGRIALGQKPLSWEAMRHHLLQVRALLRGEAVDNDGGMAQLLASSGLLPDRPIRTPLLLAAQGPKGRAVAKEIADGLVALRDPDRATARGLHATARVADRRTRRHHSELRDSFRDARNGAGLGSSATSLPIATAAPAKAPRAVPTRISRRDPSAGTELALARGVMLMRIFLCQGSWSAICCGSGPFRRHWRRSDEVLSHGRFRTGVKDSRFDLRFLGFGDAFVVMLETMAPSVSSKHLIGIGLSVSTEC
jgi:alkanesulfonate monooxygenase SsuD/methylene tetrahydromethanopterin reductase-like flavin-dependent oxidoreductase (luciferase family)